MQRETGELSSERDRRRIDGMHTRKGHRRQITQIETWRQTLRDRVKLAKRQERQRVPSPLDHTAVAVPIEKERAVGVVKGGALRGALDGRGL